MFRTCATVLLLILAVGMFADARKQHSSRFRVLQVSEHTPLNVVLNHDDHPDSALISARVSTFSSIRKSGACLAMKYKDPVLPMSVGLGGGITVTKTSTTTTLEGWIAGSVAFETTVVQAGLQLKGSVKLEYQNEDGITWSTALALYVRAEVNKRALVTSHFKDVRETIAKRLDTSIKQQKFGLQGLSESTAAAWGKYKSYGVALKGVQSRMSDWRKLVDQWLDGLPDTPEAGLNTAGSKTRNGWNNFENPMYLARIYNPGAEDVWGLDQEAKWIGATIPQYARATLRVYRAICEQVFKLKDTKLSQLKGITIKEYKRNSGMHPLELEGTENLCETAQDDVGYVLCHVARSGILLPQKLVSADKKFDHSLLSILYLKECGAVNTFEEEKLEPNEQFDFETQYFDPNALPLPEACGSLQFGDVIAGYLLDHKEFEAMTSASWPMKDAKLLSADRYPRQGLKFESKIALSAFLNVGKAKDLCAKPSLMVEFGRAKKGTIHVTKGKIETRDQSRQKTVVISWNPKKTTSFEFVIPLGGSPKFTFTQVIGHMETKLEQKDVEDWGQQHKEDVNAFVEEIFGKAKKVKGTKSGKQLVKDLEVLKKSEGSGVSKLFKCLVSLVKGGAKPLGEVWGEVEEKFSPVSVTSSQSLVFTLVVDSSSIKLQLTTDAKQALAVETPVAGVSITFTQSVGGSLTFKKGAL